MKECLTFEKPCIWKNFGPKKPVYLRGPYTLGPCNLGPYCNSKLLLSGQFPNHFSPIQEEWRNHLISCGYGCGLMIAYRVTTTWWTPKLGSLVLSPSLLGPNYFQSSASILRSFSKFSVNFLRSFSKFSIYFWGQNNW